MNPTPAHELVTKLVALQIELEALGFALDSRGSREAADVALATSARLGELRNDCGIGDCSETDVRSDSLRPLNLNKALS